MTDMDWGFMAGYVLALLTFVGGVLIYQWAGHRP